METLILFLLLTFGVAQANNDFMDEKDARSQETLEQHD